MSDVIRSCIVCRSRQLQQSLYRFVCQDHEVLSFTGVGRSFYICKQCIKDDKKVAKSTKRLCKINKDFTKSIKTALGFNNL